MEDKKRTYLIFEKFLIMMSVIGALCFAAAGMIIPPQGVIDGSVLIFCAQLLIFAGSLLGIKIYSLKAIEKLISENNKK